MGLYIGIDVGITGALAVLNAETKEIRFYDAPSLEIKVGKKFKKVPNIQEMVAILKQYRGPDVLAGVEKVNAMPDVGTGAKMGATSAFSFGTNFGLWLGILAALEIPYQQVHPATWKAKVMAGMSKEKDASRVRAMELYPHISSQLARKKDHARGDALLIARYLWLTSPTVSLPAEAPMQSLFDEEFSIS